MRRIALVLAVMLLSAASGSAQDEVARPQIAWTTEQEAEKPAPELLGLDGSLLKVHEHKRQGRIDEKGYQEFLANFRADLEAAMSLIKATPANTALHARILSRLGDSEQALAALGPALDQDPASPALRVALSQVLYDRKDYPAALAEANAVLARDPMNKAALALKYSSEGRIGTGGVALGKVAGNDFTIPPKNDISPQAMALVRQAITARREGDMARSWKNMQAAMNADPTSSGVRKLYAVAQEDQARHFQTKDYLRRSQEALDAGRGEEAIAWAQKAADRSGDATVAEILELTKQRNAQLAQPPAEHSVPKGGVPLWPIGAGLGLTAIGYAVAKSKGAWSDSEAEVPEEEDPDSMRIQRNRSRFKIAGVSAAVGFGIVYGGLWIAGAAAPFAARFVSGPGQQAMRLPQSAVGSPGRVIPPVNEVPKVLARVIPLRQGQGEPKMLGLVGDPHVFVTAADDIAGIAPGQIAARLGISPAPRYLIVKFPMPNTGIRTPTQFDNPLFLGRGVTSGGAREFQIMNMRIPTNAVKEIVEVSAMSR